MRAFLRLSLTLSHSPSRAHSLHYSALSAKRWGSLFFSFLYKETTPFPEAEQQPQCLAPGLQFFLCSCPAEAAAERRCPSLGRFRLSPAL